jgi:hypothetical protein
MKSTVFAIGLQPGEADAKSVCDAHAVCRFSSLEKETIR